MSLRPAIVIAAYNRAHSLSRLLRSVAAATYAGVVVDCIISIDFSGFEDVHEIAKQFEWPYGSKQIIVHPAHLGLKAHILACGDLTTVYGAVILLEDDLVVAPFFYEYALQAVRFYESDTKIAGISLYSYDVAESCFYPFKAIDDGSDVYFMQVGSSWGQIWTHEQWKGFRNWFAEHQELPHEANVPEYLHVWGVRSWKRHFVHYMIDSGRYFVFPRISLTTNFEEPGTHAGLKNVFHVPLRLASHSYSFCNYGASRAIYDAWFEITPEALNKWNPALAAYDYSVDFYNVKQQTAYNTRYVLTTLQGQKPVISFGKEIFPFEASIALGLPGTDIGLYEQAGATLRSVPLGLHHILGEPLPRPILITLIVPIVAWSADLFGSTINSVRTQKYEQWEIVVVVHQSDAAVVSRYLYYEERRISVFITDQLPSLLNYIQLGFGQVKEGIVGWLNVGSTLSVGALNCVQPIFRDYQNVNWIRGVNDMGDSPEVTVGFVGPNCRPMPQTAPVLMKEGLLNVRGELDFLRLHCIRDTCLEASSFEQSFLACIARFQLMIVVAKLGEIAVARKNEPVNTGEMEQLYADFIFLKKGLTWKKRALGWIAKNIFPNSVAMGMVLLYVNEYHDVLRKNSDGSYYFSKR